MGTRSRAKRGIGRSGWRGTAWRRHSATPRCSRQPPSGTSGAARRAGTRLFPAPSTVRRRTGSVRRSRRSTRVVAQPACDRGDPTASAAPSASCAHEGPDRAGALAFLAPGIDRLDVGDRRFDRAHMRRHQADVVLDARENSEVGMSAGETRVRSDQAEALIQKLERETAIVLLELESMVGSDARRRCRPSSGSP